MIRLSEPWIGDEERAAVLAVLDSGQLSQGPNVKALELAFAEVTHTAHAVACSNGSSALYLALRALEIGPGDEVITTPFSFIATAHAILLAGARPVFVDVDEVTFNIDPKYVEAAITPKTKAILPVHLFGQPADLNALAAIAVRHRLQILEDGAQAIGAAIGSVPIGAHHTTTFSLYATKNVTAGEGGMVTTSSPVIAERLRSLRSHGMSAPNHFTELGFNFRLPELSAALARAQLDRRDEARALRARNAAYLQTSLREVIVPQTTEGTTHAWHQFTVRVPPTRRDALIAHLRSNNIEAKCFYPIPMHLQPHINQVSPASLPIAERLAGEVLSLPVHPRLSESDLEFIARTMNQFFR